MKRSSTDTSTLSIGIKSFDRINRKYRASNMRRIFPEAGKYEAKHRKYGLHLWYEIIIPEGENPEAVAKAYGLDENIQASEPRYKIRSLAMPASPLPLAEIPNDPSFTKQWNYNNTGQTGGTPGVDIRLPDAWETAKNLGIKNRDVIVAVMDGGVYYNHEDLNANMWVNQLEKDGISGKDDDGNKYVDDIYGYNFVSRTNGVISPEDHATHVAGTIAAVTNNGTGVSGIAGNPAQGYGIKIMTVQIMDGNRSVSSLGAAYTYAADNGAVISQNSWGYDDAGYYNQSDVTAINYFINEAGRDEYGNPRPGTPMAGGIVIFAAGNDTQDAKWYPAYFNNVLAVAAVNHYGKLAWYSNYGNWVDISAPGGDTDERGTNKTGGIYSTSYSLAIKNYYEYMQGTSMACPHVSGAAALILSVHGSESFTPDMLRTRLLNTTTPLDQFDPVNAPKMGAGLLNANDALAPWGIPGPTTDLVAITINNVSAQLAWTVPAVSDNGSVVAFEVACSTSKITADNFDQLITASVKTSVASGDEQEYTLAGLMPSTSYYVAVRNIGNIGDRSAISNVAVFTTNVNHAPKVTKQIPDITLIPHETPAIIDLSQYITDEDGDQLSYKYSVDNDEIVNAEIMDNILTIDPQHFGIATLQLTATDPFGETVAITVHVTVELKYSPDKTGELLVYPNPVTDILNYSFILDESASVIIRIANVSGQVVYQIPATGLSAGKYYYSVDISAWSSGVYILQYISNGKTMDTKKVMKL